MKNLFGLFSKKSLSSILMTVIAGLTLATSVGGVMKVAGSMNSYKPKVPEVKTVQAALQEESELIKTDDKKPETKPSPTVTTAPRTVRSSLALNTTPTPTPSLTPSASGTNGSTTNSSACIITLFWKQYDVTSLQSGHPGGNVFKCGTDQTVLYQSQHGTDLSRMQPYLVTGSNSSSSSGSTSLSGSGGSSGSSNGSGSTSGIQIDNETETEVEHEDNKEQHVEETQSSENREHIEDEDVSTEKK